MIDGTRENKTKIKQRPQYNLYIPLRWNTCWNLYCYSPQYLSHWRHLPDYKQHRAWGSLWPVGKEAPVFQGQARSGTLVQYGDESNNCGAINLQFDAGRGTTQRLSQAKTPIGKLQAIFFTNLHSDHTEGLAAMMQLHWHFDSAGPKVDLVCIVGPDLTSLQLPQ